MPNKHNTIRVINPTDTKDMNHLRGVWVEQLRRLGIVNVLGENDDRQVLEFECPFNPRKIDDEAWARTNAERMRSFGINAVAAPRWDGREPVKL